MHYANNRGVSDGGQPPRSVSLPDETNVHTNETQRKERTMKTNLLFAMTVMIMALTAGCEDRQPVEAPGQSPSELLAKASCEGILLLDGKIPVVVMEPNPPALPQLMLISGQVNYQMHPTPIATRDMIAFSLGLDATVRPLNGTEPLWIFSGESEEVVVLPSKGLGLLLKTYKVLAPGQVLKLFVELGFSECKMTIEQMWVERIIVPPALPDVD
jgi:hypothetical protein